MTHSSLLLITNWLYCFIDLLLRQQEVKEENIKGDIKYINHATRVKLKSSRRSEK
jgi:hypothetical protein